MNTHTKKPSRHGGNDSNLSDPYYIPTMDELSNHYRRDISTFVLDVVFIAALIALVAIGGTIAS